MRRLVILLSILFPLAFVFITCGGGGGGADVEKVSSVTLLSSAPADGAIKVSRLSDIQMTFSGDLHGQTITSSNISLYRLSRTQDPLLLQCSIDYDSATRTITVTPSKPLWNDREYALTLSGVRDSGGATLKDLTISFQTYLNLPVSDTYYDVLGNMIRYAIYTWDPDGRFHYVVSYDSNDEVLYANLHSFDASGNETQQVYSGGPGPDGQWLTGDDLVYSYETYTYHSNNKKSEVVEYREPGSDGDWFTVDDQVGWRGTFNEKGNPLESISYDVQGDIQEINLITYNNRGDEIRNVRYDGPGGDGVWLTEDDDVFDYHSYTYDSEGNMTIEAYYHSYWGNGAGNDGLWFTEDDKPSWFELTTYDADGKKIRTVTYDDTGSDGEWYTSDDQVYWSSYVRDAYGNATRIIYYYDVGSDGERFTEDDLVSSSVSLTYNANGDLTKYSNFIESGADGEWFTVDDQLGSYETNSYDDRGNLIEKIKYLDFDKSYEAEFYAYDADGLLIKHVDSDGPGFDGLWLTHDDQVNYYRTYTYDIHGNIINVTSYGDMGNDNEWFTVDDVVSSIWLYDTSR